MVGRNDLQTGLKWAVWILLLLSVGVFIYWVIMENIGHIDYLSLAPPYEVPELARVIGATGSVLFSLALVLLYEQQTFIQERQEKWMEANHAPDITVERWRANSNKIIFWLTNFGNGVAKNLEVVIDIEGISLESSVRILHANCQTPLGREGTVAHSIEPKQTDPIKFECFPEFSIKGIQDDGSFSEAINEGRGRNFNHLRVKIAIEFEYIRQDSSSIDTAEFEVKTEEELTLEDALVQAYNFDSLDTHVLPENR